MSQNTGEKIEKIEWATATARMREDGAVWIPSAVRDVLGIHGKKAIVEIKVRVVGEL